MSQEFKIQVEGGFSTSCLLLFVSDTSGRDKMENYFSFNEKALAVVGINLKAPGRFDIPLKVVALTVLSVATFQNFMYAALSDAVSFDLANAVTLTLYGTMGCAKLLTAILHQKEL